MLTTTWTPNDIIAAYRRWESVTGAPPTSAQWQKSNPGYPSYTVVRKHFDSWADLVAAAASTNGNHAQAERIELTEELVEVASAFPPSDEGAKPEPADDDETQPEGLGTLGARAEQLRVELTAARTVVRDLEEELQPVLERIRDQASQLIETELAA